MMRLLLFVALMSVACTPPAAPPPPQQPGAIDWQVWGPEIFERAKATHRLILIDAGIEGCTACRNMHVDTYGDPTIIARVDKSFVAVSVDADQQPDLGERFSPWGWPATIFVNAEGQQVAAIRGSRSPRDFAKILDEVVARGPEPPGGVRGPSLENLDLSARCTRMLDRLDEVGDDHGWGGRVRPVEATAVLLSFRRAHIHGEKRRMARALAVVDGIVGLVDPVWGGVYVAARNERWEGIIPEKRVVHQAHALAAFAEAHQLTGQQRYRDAAAAVLSYLDAFMQSPEGTYFSTQQDEPPGLPRGMTAVDYYALDDQGRRKLGVPPVDHGIYTDQNAWVIMGLVRLYLATGELSVLRRATTAAAALWRSRLREPSNAVGWIAQTEANEWLSRDRRLRHAAQEDRMYLVAQAYFGLAMIDLYRATGGERWLDNAKRLAKAVMRLADDEEGGFYAAAETRAGLPRDKPYLANLTATRLLIAVDQLSGMSHHREHVERTLRYVGQRGVLRMIGPENIATYALALDELFSLPIAVNVWGEDAALRHRALTLYEPRKQLMWRSGKPAFTVCIGDVCSDTVDDPELMAQKRAAAIETLKGKGGMPFELACATSP